MSHVASGRLAQLLASVARTPLQIISVEMQRELMRRQHNIHSHHADASSGDPSGPTKPIAELDGLGLCDIGTDSPSRSAHANLRRKLAVPSLEPRALPKGYVQDSRDMFGRCHTRLAFNRKAPSPVACFRPTLTRKRRPFAPMPPAERLRRRPRSVLMLRRVPLPSCPLAASNITRA